MATNLLDQSIRPIDPRRVLLSLMADPSAASKAVAPRGRVPAARMTYKNLDLYLEQKDNDLRVRVLRSDFGEPNGVGPVPPYPETIGQPGALARYLGAQPEAAHTNFAGGLKTWGEAVGSALFPGEVGDAFRAARMQLKYGEGIRIRVILEDATLAPIPWEAAFFAGEYMSLSRTSPIVRYIRTPRPNPVLTVQGPVRILGVISNPSMPGHALLDATLERSKLSSALADLVDQELVELHWLPQANTISLQNKLQDEYHVLHFIGHSRHDRLTGRGELMFEGNAGSPVPVPAAFLCQGLLADSTVRFAFLNSCQSGQAIGGLAEELVRHGLAAAIGMHTTILDAVAIRFAQGFYGALGKRLPIECAVVEGRKTIFNTLPYDLHQPDWVDPVLYMCSPDGCLFPDPEPSGVSML